MADSITNDSARDPATSALSSHAKSKVVTDVPLFVELPLSVSYSPCVESVGRITKLQAPCQYVNQDEVSMTQWGVDCWIVRKDLGQENQQDIKHVATTELLLSD